MSIKNPVAFWPGVAPVNTMEGEPTLIFENLSANVEDFVVKITHALLAFLNAFNETNVVATSNLMQTTIPVTSTSFLAAYSYAATMFWQLYATALGSLPSVLLWEKLPLDNNGDLSFSHILLMQQYALDNIIVASHIGANALVLSFFFHGRGADLERTVPGLFRTLLYQLLSRGHTVWSELKDLFPSTTDESDKKWQCELPKLKKFASESLGESLGLVIGRRTRRMWRRAGGRPYPVLQGPAGLSQVLICCPSAISHLLQVSPISSSRSRHWVRNMPRE